MLKEISISSDDTDHVKRWFTDQNTDLFVWLDESGHINRFQICYNKGHNEHALTWVRNSGFTHHAVDDGEGKVMKMKKSPILIQNGRIDYAGVAGLVEEIGGELPAFIYNFVLGTLKTS